MDLFLIGIILFAIIVRVIQSEIGKHLNAPDHYYHLIATDEIRKNHHKIPISNSRFLIFNKFTAYPFLIHYFYSFIAKDVFEKICRYQAAVFDTIQIIVLFWYSKILVAKLGIIVPYYIPYVCIFLYSVYPIFFKIGDSRNITLNARPVGELFSNISILSLIIFNSDGNYLYLFTAILLGSLVFLSSKFGTQAFVFISLLISILSWNIFFAIIPFVSFILAIIISRGKYLEVINGHITHSYFIFRVRGNPGLDYTLIIKALKKIFRNPLKTIEELYKFPLFSILLHSPFYIVLLFFYLKQNTLLKSFDEIRLLSIWAFSGFLVVIITSFKKTKFLGEADRYGLYTVFPLVIIIPFLASYSNLDAYFSIFIIFSILFVLYILVTYIVWSLMPSRRYHQELINFLKTLPPDNCVTNPISLSYEIAYLTPHKILYNPPGFGFSLKNYNKDLLLYKELYYKYPLITKNISSITRKYNLSYLVFRKRYSYKSYSNIQDLREEYELNSFENIFENNDFIVFHLKI